MNDKEILPRKTREPINLVSQEMCINDYTNNLMNKYLILKVYNRYFLKHKILSSSYQGNAHIFLLCTEYETLK